MYLTHIAWKLYQLGTRYIIRNISNLDPFEKNKNNNKIRPSTNIQKPRAFKKLYQVFIIQP